jgi:hypothetical protein
MRMMASAVYSPEDVTQTVALEFCKQYSPQKEHCDSVVNLIARMTFFEVVGSLRRIVIERRLFVALPSDEMDLDGEEERTASYIELRDPRPGPDDDIRRLTFWAEICKYIEPRCKDILELRYEGFSREAISIKLRISPKTYSNDKSDNLRRIYEIPDVKKRVSK